MDGRSGNRVRVALDGLLLTWTVAYGRVCSDLTGRGSDPGAGDVSDARREDFLMIRKGSVGVGERMSRAVVCG